MVLSGPNLPHCWRDDPDPAGTEHPDWIIVQFDPACFGLDFLRLAEAAVLHEMLRDAHHGLAFEPTALKEVGPLLHELVNLNGLTRLVGLIGIRERLTRQPRQPLATTNYHVSNNVNRSLVDRIEFIQRYIIDNLSGEISQADIAARLGMRPPAFSKFYRAATGRTFMSLVKLLRVNESCRLLATTEERITGIAFDCGYSNA